MKKQTSKYIIRISAVTMAGILAAAPTMLEANAAQTADASSKEEVVYGMLTADGQPDGVYVVNIFDDQDITDYGDYTSVRNLTTTDEVEEDGDVIHIHRADASDENEKLYYQGDLDTTDLPWNIDIRYYMDQKQYDADEIAGMSGELKIRIHITQNASCDDSFWEGYALQATVTLDAQKCRNIEAQNATIANVGSDKQLSYIILPGKGADLTITADVTDFEMDEIAINGTKLDLDFDLDTEELTDKIAEVQDAIAELNDGTGELYDGAESLSDGAKSLETGISDLNDGIAQVESALSALDGKSDDLTKGSAEVMKALETIDSSLAQVKISTQDLQTLSDSSTQIKNGMDSLVGGLKTIESSIDSYYAQLAAAGVSSSDLIAANQQALNSLAITGTQRQLYAAYTSGGAAGAQNKMAELVQSGDAEAGNLYAQYAASGYDSQILTDYLTTAGKLISVETLLQGDVSYIAGSSALIDGIDSQLDSQKGELMQGALTLQSSYAEFDTAVQGMVTSLENLAGSMDTLKTAINTLTTQYAALDDGIGTYTDAVSQILAGYNKIYSGSASAAAGAKDLYSGTVELVDGAAQLYDGTTEFQNETEDMDTEVDDKINETIDDLTGKNVETVSFVSEKNTNVESVLFVMKTPAIEIAEEEEETVVQEEDAGVIQKFLNLFRK